MRKLGAADCASFGRGKHLTRDDLDELVGRLVLADVLAERSVETGSGFTADYVFRGDRADTYATFAFDVRCKRGKQAPQRLETRVR